MLPARHRMRRSADFRVAVRSGRRVGRTSVVLHVAAAEDAAGPTRVGFVVSRAVGPAVTRNLVKRRLREVIRAQLGELPAGALLVVRATPAAATRSWPSLRRDVQAALDRAALGPRRGSHGTSGRPGPGRGGDS